MFGRQQTSRGGGAVLAVVLGSLLLGGSSPAADPDLEAECDDFDDFRVDWNPLDASPMEWVRTNWNASGEVGDCSLHGMGEPGLHLRETTGGQFSTGFLSKQLYEGDVSFRVEVVPIGRESGILVMAHFEQNAGWGYSAFLGTWRNGSRNLHLKRWDNYSPDTLDTGSVAVQPDAAMTLELRIAGGDITLAAWVSGQEPPPRPQLFYPDPDPLPWGSVGFQVGAEGSEGCFHWVCVNGSPVPTCPSNLLADAREDGVELRWVNFGRSDELRIARDGEEVAVIAGSLAAYLDTEVSDGQSEGHHTYSIVPTTGPCSALERTIEVIVPEGIVSVTRGGGSPNKAPLISQASLHDGAVPFVDSDHVFANVPELLEGAEYIQTASGDKTVEDHSLDVQIDQPGTLYLLLDWRILNVMPWVATLGFEDTTESVDIDEKNDGTVDSRLQVYALAVVPGGYTLGEQDDGNDRNMYVVAFQASDGPPPPKVFHRGDANADGGLDVTDAIFVFNFLFLGGPEPACKDAGDADDSGVLDITDGIFVLNFLFLGGDPPPPPGPPGADCGPDPGDAALSSCAAYTNC